MNTNQYIKTATDFIIEVAERRLSAMHGKPVKLRVELGTESKEANPEDIILCVSEVTGISVCALKSPTRKREVVEARQIAMSIIAENTKLSLKAIGRLFGGRDHSTVIHAKYMVEDLNYTDKQFKHKFSRCVTAANRRCLNNRHGAIRLLTPTT